MNEYTLEVEGLKRTTVASFQAVERSLRSLKPYGGKTFAILDRGDGSYLQVAGGQISCAVELHRSADTAAGKHWRAFLDAPHGNYPSPVTKHFGAGTIIVQPDEVLWIDDVIAVFEQFMSGEDFPAAVSWREMSGIG